MNGSQVGRLEWVSLGRKHQSMVGRLLQSQMHVKFLAMIEIGSLRVRHVSASLFIKQIFRSQNFELSEETENLSPQEERGYQN